MDSPQASRPKHPLPEPSPLEASLLQSTEICIRAVAEISHSAILLLGRDGTILTWNRGAHRLFGWSEEEALRQPLSLLFPEAERQMGGVQELLRQAEQEGQTHLEGWRARRDGSLLWAQMEVTTLRQADGAPLGFMHTLRDETEEHQQRVQLEENQQRYRSLLENNPDPVFALSPEGSFVEMNEAASRVSGYTVEEFQGRSFLEMVAPESQEAALRAFQEALQGRPQNLSLFILHKEGTRVELEVRAVPMRVRGEVTGVFGIAEDVTEHRRVQREMQEQRRFLRSVIDTSPNLIFAKDAQGCFTLANRAVADLYGTVPEELEGKTDADFNPNQEEVERFREADREVIEGGHWHVVPEEPVTDQKTGETRWFQTRKIPLVSPDGSRQVLGISTEITERKRAEGALKESEERFRSAFEDAAIGMALVQVDGRAFRVNQALCEMLGYSEEELLARSAFEVTHPDDVAMDIYFAERALRGETCAYQLEKRYLKKDGSAIWALLSVSLVHDSEGRPAYVVAQIQDIHERKKAEEALQEHARLVETLHSLGASFASELDLQAVVQRVSEAATQIIAAQYGASFYNLQNEDGASYTLFNVSGAPLETFSDLLLPSNMTGAHAASFATRGVVRSEDVEVDPRFRTESGERQPLPLDPLPVRSYLAVPVHNRSGEFLGEIFFGHPEIGFFTEQHERLAIGIAGWASVAVDNARLYQEERRARSEAEEANQVKDAFLATMSHELRTPINAVIGYSDLLLLGVPAAIPEVAQVQVKRIEASARHLLGLIEEILTFSRIEAGKEECLWEKVEVSTLLSDVIATVEPLAQQKGLTPRLKAPAEPLSLVTDARKLRQILLNLLANAVKFTHQGEVGIEAWQEGEDIYFRIWDTGIGIAPGHLERVFEPFFQAETAKHLRVNGTGLGLGIVREFASLLGGEITVESDLGQGSRFTVCLPMKRP